jgi:hypothetical protein
MSVFATSSWLITDQKTLDPDLFEKMPVLQAHFLWGEFVLLSVWGCSSSVSDFSVSSPWGC